MPSLLCPSPIILDLSFPRDDDEMRIAAEALAVLKDCIADKVAEIVLTITLQDFVMSNIEYGRSPRELALLNEICRFIQQLILQPFPGVHVLPVVDEDEVRPHPIPNNCHGKGWIDYWSVEMGKLLQWHDRYIHKDEYYIGVACAYAFTGNPISSYIKLDSERAFPLVGPDTIGVLHDAYEWNISANDRAKSIRVSDIKANCGALGAVNVNDSTGSSHCQITFHNGKKWPLDTHYDPVPERHIRQLEHLTGYPLGVVKYALSHGALPEKIPILPI